MSNEIVRIEPDPPLEIPDARPYIIGAMAGTVLIYTIASRLLKGHAAGSGWDAVSAAVPPPRAPRQWTTAFSASDRFLAQLKDIAPTELPKS
jgi:hypothetical protein